MKFQNHLVCGHCSSDSLPNILCNAVHTWNRQRAFTGDVTQGALGLWLVTVWVSRDDLGDASWLQCDATSAYLAAQSQFFGKSFDQEKHKFVFHNASAQITTNCQIAYEAFLLVVRSNIVIWHTSRNFPNLPTYTCQFTCPITYRRTQKTKIIWFFPKATLYIFHLFNSFWAKPNFF